MRAKAGALCQVTKAFQHNNSYQSLCKPVGLCGSRYGSSGMCRCLFMWRWGLFGGGAEGGGRLWRVQAPHFTIPYEGADLYRAYITQPPGAAGVSASMFSETGWRWRGIGSDLMLLPRVKGCGKRYGSDRRECKKSEKQHTKKKKINV